MCTARGPRFFLGSVYNARRKLFVPAEFWRAFLLLHHTSICPGRYQLILRNFPRTARQQLFPESALPRPFRRTDRPPTGTSWRIRHRLSAEVRHRSPKRGRSTRETCVPTRPSLGILVRAGSRRYSAPSVAEPLGATPLFLGRCGMTARVFLPGCSPRLPAPGEVRPFAHG